MKSEEAIFYTKEGWAGLKKDSHMTRWMIEHGDILTDSFCAHVLVPLIKPGDVIVDAGAMYGDHSIPYARKTGETGLVHAFEPFLDSFKCLEHNSKKHGKNIQAYNVGLGEREETVRMTVDESGNFGASRIASFGTAPCRIIPLDSLNLPRLDFFHMDIEGYELFALRGAEQTINRCKPRRIVCEINRGCMAANGYDAKAIESFMAQLGYKPTIQNSEAQYDQIFVLK